MFAWDIQYPSGLGVGGFSIIDAMGLAPLQSNFSFLCSAST